MEGYTVASTFPIKLLRNDVVKDGRIIPLHPQLNITNKCNRSCPTCCYKSKSDTQLSLDNILTIYGHMFKVGTQAVTITGGGEPGCHKNLSRIINMLAGINVGLVTNGYRLSQMFLKRNLDWMRISYSDDLKFLKPVLHLMPARDIGLSYIVSNNPDWNNLNEVVKYANDESILKISHVRIRQDAYNIGDVPEWNVVAKHIRYPLNKVIWQNMIAAPEKKCEVCFLRPVIGADNKIYPCPFNQVIIAENLIELYENQHSIHISCDNCFYTDYNKFLRMMKLEVKHRKFA